MLHLIVNPNTKKSHKVLAAAENLLKERGAEYDVFRSEKKGDIRREVARLTEEGETTVVAVGGDGTLNEVLAGIVDPARTILGLIPAGTGNDFASAAHIPYGEKAVGSPNLPTFSTAGRRDGASTSQGSASTSTSSRGGSAKRRRARRCPTSPASSAPFSPTVPSR